MAQVESRERSRVDVIVLLLEKSDGSATSWSSLLEMLQTAEARMLLLKRYPKRRLKLVGEMSAKVRQHLKWVRKKEAKRRR